MQKPLFKTQSRTLSKNTLALLALFTVVMTYAQNTTPFLTSIQNLTPQQQQSYVKEARQRGYSLTQLQGLAKAQGATLDDLTLLQSVWSETEKNSNGSVAEEATDKIETNFGENGDLTFFPDTTEEESDIFGSSFFNNTSITQTPQLYVSTPAGYRLGPNDEITIDVWGASENRYEATLSRQGVVRIDRLKPMYLSGLTLAAAKRKIQKEFAAIYTGLSDNAEEASRVYLDVNLQKARSIVVNITGNVNAPGTYTISGFSSVLNALYAAGGPTENGSYRDVTILRGGKKAGSVDLYDYFVKGTYPSMFLNDQDVIVVAPHHKRVTADGAFKTTGRFEALAGETLDDLLFFTGGYASAAYKKAVYIDRIVELEREILKVNISDYSSTELADGDIVQAKEVSDKYTNKISVSGEVYLPGNYPLDQTPTISLLLKSSNGLTPDAYSEAAILYRSKQGFVNEIQTINLVEVLENTNDINLQANDSLVIMSMKNINPERSVSLRGYVKEPGEFPFFEGMTARDLLLMGNGFKDQADVGSIELYSNITEKKQNKKVASRWFSFDEASEIIIKASDLMVVRLKAGFQPTTFVRLEGQVARPGTYPIIKENYSLYDLYYDAGGALAGANFQGVSIERKITKETQENIEETADSLNLFFLEEEDNEIKIGIDFSEVLAKKGDHPDNVLLKSNDVITIPRFDNTISVLGEVQRETATPYKKGISLRNAVIKSGGLKQESDYKNAYVVYQNGDVKGTKRFLFFNIRPKLEPGAIVVVPKKSEKNKMTLQESISVTTALASLTLIVRSLITN